MLSSPAFLAQAALAERNLLAQTSHREAAARALIDMLRQGLTPPPVPIHIVRYVKDLADTNLLDNLDTYGRHHHRTIQAARVRHQSRNLPTRLG